VRRDDAARPFLILAMRYEIRDALGEDISQVLQLLREFADLVNLSEYLTVDEELLRAAVLSDDAFVQLIVACDGGDVIGYAIFYPHFSSFRGESGIFLEDIFITDRHRGSGVGRLLLGEIARRGKARGFSRIDFQVMTSNTGARRFYERLGGESNPDDIRFKFAGTAFDRLADGSSD
jgi:ribosomal protein S18 acetylase RimI-like enzyme